MRPDEFIRKWSAVALSERSAAQQHFLDVCSLLGEPPPAESDPTGDTFTFEKGGTTATGGHGWADVWKKGAFAWEYKGPGKDLNAAYLQLKKYADMLENPPLLITSDTKRIEIHTNFTNTVKVVEVIELSDLADPAKRELLRAAFKNPERLRPGITRQQVTTDAAERLSELAHHLQSKGYDPQRVAHFLNRLIFCMFAEDVGLLPNRIFTKLATASVAHPEAFEVNARQLFAGMSKGGAVAFEIIEWFNGGLFDDDSTLPLDADELKLVLQCAELDWSNIEPSIFGTLFERGLDPDKRSQQGAHYTDPETIMKIVRPVVVGYWEREWSSERTVIAKLIDRAHRTVSESARKRYFSFLKRLSEFRVLDPACGSGNFLYLALRSLKDFERRVINDAETLGLAPPFPAVGPEAVLGIEVNPYAAELARVTIWIGELQWMLENGFQAAKNPILKSLDQIECRDAIVDDDGTEPKWPPADVIVGNPPFLGSQKQRSELGDEYVERLRQLYAGRIPAGVDLVCYWFEKARKQLASGEVKAVGLVATNSIRGGANRSVLDLIVKEQRIFEAWADEPWVNEGASVRVSLIAFGAGHDTPVLDGVTVPGISTDLTVSSTDHADLTSVSPLPGNRSRCFQGSVKVGEFNVPGSTAREWLLLSNPHGLSNADVLRPLRNAKDLTSRPRDEWIVDFGRRTEKEAALYEAPFEHVERLVRPARATNPDKSRRENWWLHGRTGDEIRRAVGTLSRVIVTPRVSKHRFFVFVHSRVYCDDATVTVAADDYVTFGILSSRFHELWALRLGTSLEDRPRYTPTTCFETFPFPDWYSPGQSHVGLEVGKASRSVWESARRLDELREGWLNPPELVVSVEESAAGYPPRIVPRDAGAEKELKKRTMTSLYNTRPAWLRHAHEDLDSAVAAAYGWDWPLNDQAVLDALLQRNRAGSLPLQVE